MWTILKKLRKEYFSLNLSDSINYEKFSMISIVYNSTKIEGCSLDEADTRILIENGLTARGKPLNDHLMVKDHFDAFLYIKDQAKLKRKLSANFIKTVNGLINKHTGGITKTALGNFDTSKGDLRLTQVYVDKRYFPNFSKVPDMLDALCEKINQRIDAVLDEEVLKLAADIHYRLVDIHPFGDGNGRTARLFMNYIQLYHKEPLIKIFTQDRKEYLHALNYTDEKKDVEIFRKFICAQQIKFLKAEIDKFKSMGA